MLFTYIIYNVILLFVLIFGYYVKVSSTKLSEYICRTIVFLSIVIPASIRKGIGTDYWSYVGLYQWYSTNSDEHEIGFQLLGKLMNFFGFSYQSFIASLAILAFAPVCYYVPKRNFYPFIVIYFFLLFLSCISTTRQAISIALVTCGIFALYKEKGTMKYLFCVVLAFFFHYSSILYFPILLFKNIKFSNTNIYICLGIILMIMSRADFIDNLFASSIFQDSPYGVYATIGQYNREAEVGTGLGIILNLMLPCLFLMLNRKISKYYDHVGFFVFLTMLFVTSYFLASKVHILGRLMGCFIFLPAFLIHPVCKTLSLKYNNFLIFLFFIIYLILYEKMIAVSQSSLGNGLGISPYTTIFD